MSLFIREQSGNLIFDGVIEIALNTIKKEGRKAKLLIFTELLYVLNAAWMLFIPYLI